MTIRNDQYLHRPTAGRGAIKPDDPLEVRLYGPNGQPLSVIDNKLAVRAADLETLIGALNDSAVTNPANAASVIAALKGLLSVVGKEATLGQILSALAPLATERTL